MISLIDRIDRGKLFSRFLLIHSIILISAWVLILFHIKWIVIPLFSYAYVSKIFTFLIFWTLANDIVDSRKAARDFPRIAAGGTLGAISISFLIPQIVGKIDAEYLLPVWAGINGLVILLFQPIRRQFGRNFLATKEPGKQKSKVQKMVEDVLTIGKDPLLISMAFFYFLLFFVLLNQQYGFYNVLKNRYTEASELSAFLGYFNGFSMVVTFLLQMTLSGYVIRKIGSTRAMLILPIIFTIVFFILGVIPYCGVSSTGVDTVLILFWGTVAGLGFRIAVFDSFYSPNFQIFFSSLPKAIRGRGKIALEGVVKPIAMGVASLWLTLIMPKLPHSISTLVLIISSTAMILLTLLMKRQYTKSLTQYLSDFKTKGSADVSNQLKDHHIVQRIETTLKGESHHVQCYMVELLGDINSQPATNVLIKLLYQKNEKLLPTIIDALTPKAIPHLKKTYKELIQSDNPHIVKEAMMALAEYPDEKQGLLTFLHSDQLELKLTVIELLWWDVSRSIKDEMLDEIERGLHSNDANTIFRTLNLCGHIDAPELTNKIPERFPGFDDPLLQSQQGWERFTSALSNLEGVVILNWILSNSLQLSAAKLPSLIPAVANIIQTGFTAEKVLKRMNGATREERFLLSGGLLLEGTPLKQHKRKIEKLFTEELHQLTIHRENISHLKAAVSATLLTHAVEEELFLLHLQTAIALVSLLDKKGEIGNVAKRLLSKKQSIRSRALEVLDNVGDMRLNNQLITHFTPITAETYSEQLFIKTVRQYKHYPNNWVQECAAFTIEKCKEDQS